MSSLERLKSALASFAWGDASAEQRETVRAAIQSGQVALATGERAIAVGGDANGAAFVTGDNNVLLTVSASTAEAVKQAIASLFRRSPNQLPADLPDFQGRQEQVEKLRAALTGGGTAAVTAIGGMGGIGKSALALHVAHQLADAAPDGQIFVDLGGTSPQPLTSLAAMMAVIQALRPEAQPPTELGLAQSLYRSCLDGKRVLLLLDDAANSAQVAPLVEWRTPTTLVIITSRQTIAAPGLTSLSLDVMEPGEARDLLKLALSERSAIDQELDALSDRCGRLPLALRVAGTFLALNRDWSVAEYIKSLADQRRRLAWLRIEDDTRLDVHAVLGFSARKLAEDKPELFERWQMLAVFPASFDRLAVSAVWVWDADEEEGEARKGLSDLLRRSMVSYDEAEGRYRLHDLMRDVARLPLEGEDQATVEQRLEEAAARHARHYCRVLAAANELYLNGGENVLAGLALYDLERRNIAAGQAWAVERIEISDNAARLAAEDASAEVLNLRLTPRAWIGWLEAQLKACRSLGERQSESATLGHLGIAYADLGEPRRAIEYHEKALTIAREIGNRQGEGATLCNLGLAYAALGQARRAIEYYEQSLAIAREIGDWQGEGHTVGNLGMAHHDLGEPRQAIEYYEQSLAIAREFGDRRSEGQTLTNLGNAYDALGERRRAIEYHEEALTIAREIEDRHSEGSALGNLGNAHAALGEPRRAIEHHEEALTIAREIGDRAGEGAALCNLGLVYAHLGEPRWAIDYHEQDLAIACEIGNRRGEARALCNLGLVYADLGEPRRAIDHQEQHLTIAREIGDRRGESTALGNLGVAYAELGEPRRAIDYHEQHLTIAHEIGDREGESHALGNLGLAHAHLGEPRRAIEYYEQVLAIAREIGNRRDEGATLGNLGNAYAVLDEPRRAIEYYEQDLAIAREIGNRRGEGGALGNLGVAYADLGEPRRAIDHHEQHLTIAREIGDRRGEGTALGNLGTAYTALGEPRRAIEHHEQHLAIAREIGDRQGEGNSLYGSAVAFDQLGERDDAIRRMEEALRIYEQIEDPSRQDAQAKLAEWRGEGGN